MKITKDYLKQIIEEESKDILEAEDPEGSGEVNAFMKAADAPLKQYVPLLKKLAANPEFRKLAGAGKTDGNPNDEVIEITEGTSAPANKLQATQLEIGFGNSLADVCINKFGSAKKALGLDGEPIIMPCNPKANPEGCPAILTFGKYILDGHHRWSQVMMMNPTGEVKIDSLQSSTLVDDFSTALKIMQLAIAVKAGKVITKDLSGADLMKATPENVYKYAVENINDEVIGLLIDAGKISSGQGREEAAKYIAGNLNEIKQRQGIFSRPAVMPQAGDSGVAQSDVNDFIQTGELNFNSPALSDITESQKQSRNLLAISKKRLEEIIKEEIINRKRK